VKARYKTASKPAQEHWCTDANTNKSPSYTLMVSRNSVLVTAQLEDFGKHAGHDKWKLFPDSDRWKGQS
jgi:hypothetical protein